MPPLLEIDIFPEGDFAGVRGGRGQRNRLHRAHPKSGPSWGPYPSRQGLEGYLARRASVAGTVPVSIHSVMGCANARLSS